MTTIDHLIQNFIEIRRKSIKLWLGLKPESYHWKPDDKALSCIEMARHVLETENTYHIIVKQRGGHGETITLWHGRSYSHVQDELSFAEPFHNDFLSTIRSFSDADLNTIQIVRSERQTRTLGEFLLRCQYHESVHAGQFLSYLRTIGLERPNIWD